MTDKNNADDLISLDRQYIKNATKDQISDKDLLNFLDKGKKFLDKNVGISNQDGGKGIYYIEGLWGSGKSTFADIVCWLIKQQSQKMLRVKYTPWYMNKTDDYYVGFLDTLKSELLQHKYSGKLSSGIDKIKAAIQGVDNILLQMFYNIFGLLGSDRGQMDNKINELKDILQTDYKDYTITIILDEVDRLNSDELFHFAKILHFIKEIIDNTNQRIYCFVCINSAYIEKFDLPSQSSSENGISIYEYYSKFFNDRYDVYSDSRKTILGYAMDTFGPYLGLQKDDIEQHHRETFAKVFEDLHDKRAPIVIRTLKHIQKKIKKLQDQFDMEFELKEDFSFKDAIPKESRHNFLLELLYILTLTHSKSGWREALKAIYQETQNTWSPKHNGNQLKWFKEEIEKIGIKVFETSGTNDGKWDFYDSLSRIYRLIEPQEPNIYDWLLSNAVVDSLKKNDSTKWQQLTSKYYQKRFRGNNKGIRSIRNDSAISSLKLDDKVQEYLKRVTQNKYYRIPNDAESTEHNIEDISLLIADFDNLSFENLIGVIPSNSIEDEYHRYMFLKVFWRITNTPTGFEVFKQNRATIESKLIQQIKLLFSNREDLKDLLERYYNIEVNAHPRYITKISPMLYILNELRRKNELETILNKMSNETLIQILLGYGEIDARGQYNPFNYTDSRNLFDVIIKHVDLEKTENPTRYRVRKTEETNSSIRTAEWAQISEDDWLKIKDKLRSVVAQKTIQ